MITSVKTAFRSAVRRTAKFSNIATLPPARTSPRDAVAFAAALEVLG